MKIVKNTQFGEINTSIDGVLYKITQEGIQVEDSVAQKMSEQFLHTVEVSQVVVEESPIIEPNIE